MKIVTPGERHSDAIMRRFAADSLGISEFDEPELEKTAAKDCCEKCSEGETCVNCECHKKEASVDKKANACPECGGHMQVTGSMERCACGYAQASTIAKAAKAAKDTSVGEYYRKIFPDDYAKQLSADKEVTPPAGKKVEYGSKPVDSKVGGRVYLRTVVAEGDYKDCEVPDSHPESGASAGSGATDTPDPKWQSGDSANSVSGPEKADSHGVGGKPKDAGDVETPDVKSAGKARKDCSDCQEIKKACYKHRKAVSAESESLDLSTEHTNSVSGPEKSKSHGAGTAEPSSVSAPDLKNANRLIPRSTIAKFCPECAVEMERRGIKAVKASFIAKQIAERAEARGFLQKGRSKSARS